MHVYVIHDELRLSCGRILIALNLHLEIKVYLCCNNKSKDIGFLLLIKRS